MNEEQEKKPEPVMEKPENTPIPPSEKKTDTAKSDKSDFSWDEKAKKKDSPEVDVYKWKGVAAALGVAIILSWVFGVQFDISANKFGWSTGRGGADDVFAPEPDDPNRIPTADEVIIGESDIGIDDDAKKGDENAPITMIEFTDYDCPFCERHHTVTLPKIQENYVDTGKVQLVVRDYPLETLHPDAPKKAEATECAADQGKFFEYYDELFAQAGKEKTDLPAIAGNLGLNVDNFTACLESDKYKEEVEKDIEDGLKAGIQGTPAFIINGKVVAGALPYETFQEIFENILEQQ